MIVHPLLLQPAQDLAVSFRREGFVVHSAEKPWPEKVAKKQNCSYLEAWPPAPSCTAPRTIRRFPNPATSSTRKRP